MEEPVSQYIFDSHTHDGLNSQKVKIFSPTSSFIPFTDNVYDLGSQADSWSNIYVNNIYLTGKSQNPGGLSNIISDSIISIQATTIILSPSVHTEVSMPLISNDLIECASFRIDQTPTSGTITPDHYITINCNGVNYKIPVKS